MRQLLVSMNSLYDMFDKASMAGDGDTAQAQRKEATFEFEKSQRADHVLHPFPILAIRFALDSPRRVASAQPTVTPATSSSQHNHTPHPAVGATLRFVD